jgi:signal transduction histidine kinase
MFSLLNLPLFITDISYAISFFITVLFGLWVYLKSSRKTAHIMFLLLCLSVGVYQIAHVFGTNAADFEASRLIFNMSLALVFVVCFTVHWIAAVIEREKEHSTLIISTYLVGVVIIGLFLGYPDTYLLASAPKLYFPNYYVAGSFYWLLVLFFAYGFGSAMRMLVRSYKRADMVHRNRLMYYMAAILVCYPLGAIGFFLSYGIEVDPIFSIPFTFFIVPLAYGVLRYDVMDVKVAARKAFAYTLFVLGTALFILGSNLGNNFIHAIYPGVPGWILPLSSSLIVVLFAGYIWERMREIDILKYEFITVVTHKFRTPLTRIKWASEIIKNQAHNSDEEKLALIEIESANEHLVELTDILVGMRHENQAGYLYEFKDADLCMALEKSIHNVKTRVEAKGIEFNISCPSTPIFASIDQRRMAFAFQILVENALTYTPKGGKVEVRISSDESSIYIRVIDSGIGISKEDLNRVFNKFWRSKEAKTADTEGMGIGLFMAREIVQRHDGELYAESAGVGKGSTFTIRLPLSSGE